jgi:3-oxoacyl-[acyl-carrier-protein] synthase I
MTGSAAIVGVGARTPFGSGTAPSAAALRAGLSAVKEHLLLPSRPWTYRQAALDTGLDANLTGPDRLLALAKGALLEACAPLAAAPPGRLQLPLYLGLPELRPGFADQDAEMVQANLARLEGLPFELSEINTFLEGHAAGLTALAAASSRLCRGVLDICLVGGVDSYYHPDTMNWLDKNRQLAGGGARSAFVPGEGAAFCLLASARVQDRFGEALMHLRSAATGKESKLIKTEDVCLGEGLTNTVEAALDGFPAGQTINEVICDINGERYRGEEWGFVCLRLSHYFDDPTGYVSPADSWGDLGAASVPLFATLACQAAARGYAKGPRTMLWASSEHGLRGAAVLEHWGKSEG